MLEALANRPFLPESKELWRPNTELVAQYVKLAGRPEVQKLDPSGERARGHGHLIDHRGLDGLGLEESLRIGARHGRQPHASCDQCVPSASSH